MKKKERHAKHYKWCKIGILSLYEKKFKLKLKNSQSLYLNKILIFLKLCSLEIMTLPSL